ncbi:MAG: adenylate/guanylate cyclase domain-containing protein [Acetobacteraceae bacterium]|nr:adenylate/guanylate cyclase domain-containing protein [Acetobacteraceae bacterium]
MRPGRLDRALCPARSRGFAKSHRRLYSAVSEVITGFDGFVSRYMGDGVLVYFGYPQAHESHAERAVRPALSTVAALGRLAAKSVKLQARIGIATEWVVVGASHALEAFQNTRETARARLRSGSAAAPRGSASRQRAEAGYHRQCTAAKHKPLLRTWWSAKRTSRAVGRWSTPSVKHFRVWL